jgi:hypothetical protein
MTDANDVTPIIQKLREFVEDGYDGTFGTVAMHGSSVIGGRVSALLAEIDTLTRERDEARQDAERLREVIEFARIELGGEERDGSEHTHWCVACDDHVDGNHVVRTMLVAALTPEDA